MRSEVKVKFNNLEFGNLTKLYFFNIFAEKFNEMSYYLSNAANKLFTNSLELMPSDNYSLIRDIINKHDSHQNEKKSMFACFSKSKKKYKIDFGLKIKDQIFDLRNSITEFNKSIANLKDEDFDFTIINTKENIENKIGQYYKAYNIGIRLKDEVDKYAEFFNIGKVLEKQRRKIRSQNRKLAVLEDAKNSNDCIICMENARNVVFYPCLHLICCEDCLKTITSLSCLQCFQKIQDKVIL
jgi:hypothetical protein